MRELVTEHLMESQCKNYPISHISKVADSACYGTPMCASVCASYLKAFMYNKFEILRNSFAVPLQHTV